MEEAFRRSGLAVSNALLVLRQLPLGGDPAVAARETPYALEVVEQLFGTCATYPACSRSR